MRRILQNFHSDTMTRCRRPGGGARTGSGQSPDTAWGGEAPNLQPGLFLVRIRPSRVAGRTGWDRRDTDRPCGEEVQREVSRAIGRSDFRAGSGRLAVVVGLPIDQANIARQHRQPAVRGFW